VSIALVQSKLCGSATATIGSGVTNIDATGNFTSTTTNGSLLCFIVYATQLVNSGTGGFGTFGFSETTTGVTWTNKGTGGYSVGTGSAGSVRTTTQAFFVPNAAPISSATTITVRNGFFVPATDNITVTHEFAIYEFSGVSTSNSFTTGGALVDTLTPLNNQTSSVPSWGNITTAASDLIICSFKGDSGAATAGASYSLGQSMVTVTRGQAQYQLNSAIGSVATAFGSGSQGNWGGFTISFKPGASTAGKASYGFFFG
jgi:hypothetical protein